MAKKKKEKKPLDPQKIKNLAIMAAVFLILIGGAGFGFWLINKASFLGILVIAAAFAGSLILFIMNMNRLKVYEKLTERTKKNEEKESEKLDEDMVKCKDRIAALDARAGESGDKESA